MLIGYQNYHHSSIKFDSFDSFFSKAMHSSDLLSLPCELLKGSSWVMSSSWMLELSILKVRLPS